LDITYSAAASAAAFKVLSDPSIPRTFFKSFATFLAADDSAAFPGTGLSFPTLLPFESSSFASGSEGFGGDAAGSAGAATGAGVATGSGSFGTKG